MVDFARGQNVSVATNEVRARGVTASGLATANSANDVPKVHRARRQQRRLFTLAGPLHNALGVAGFAGQIAQDRWVDLSRGCRRVAARVLARLRGERGGEASLDAGFQTQRVLVQGSAIPRSKWWKPLYRACR